MINTRICLAEKIRQRVKKIKSRRQSFFIAALSTTCLLLLTCLGIILHNPYKIPIAFTYPYGYSSVLLRDEATAYILVAIIAFILGVSATVVCFKRKDYNHEKLKNHNKKGE